MKKRFTLMMMVLCILMSIPLKMMAESVTVHYIVDDGWADVYAYVYKNGGDYIGATWHGKKCTDIKTVGDKKVATWTLDLGGVAASDACIVFNNGKDGTDSKQNPAEGVKWTVKNNGYYDKNGETTDPSESGSEGGGGTGGGSGITEKWDTENTNRLKNHVYTKGFYLAGNFFSFQAKEGDNQITYDDAVFKFQQQKNDATNIVNGTEYEVYKVEIPASIKAHAQVMYVDEFGNKQNIFGPNSNNGFGVSYTCPATDGNTGWQELKKYTDFVEKDNYWNFESRNVSATEYSDGMYNLYIAFDAETHTVAKWKIEHDSDKRVTYFISDASNATAMPIYDAYDKNVSYFSNKFWGSVNFAKDRSYYVISNYVHDQQLVSITKDKGYGTITNDKNYLSTANKLFLQGNGGYIFSTSDQHNEFSPNEKPMPGDDLGTSVVEYQAKQANYQSAEKVNHLGIRGQVSFHEGSKIIKSVSMVGDAIPGTLKEDGTTWDFTSHAANMKYDDVEQCYTTTIVTTAGNGEKHFRFVGNHDPKINWYEDTKDDAKKKAKTPLTTEGHTADANDPNKVNYTQDGADSEEDWNIIWNRPAGRWTVRLYFYTYNVAGEPVTDYYYTISPCKDLELRDCVNIVYKSEDNKRVIQNVGNYKFLRTWSDGDAWMVSTDIDIYVVDALTPDKDKNAVTIHLKQLDSKDKSGKYNVIPANTGVILGTTKEAKDIEGGAVFHERTSLTSLNTIVVPMLAYNASEGEAAEPAVPSLLHKLIHAQVVPTSEIVDGKVTYNYLFGAGKGKSVGITPCGDNDFFMGFWISNGKGNFYSNSCYLSIDEETANILGVGIRNNQFKTDPVTGNAAKMVPGVIFDFANVGGTTGINEVVNQSTKLNDGKYYTLSGQQVEKPTAGGIYIHNGRKFVVK